MGTGMELKCPKCRFKKKFFLGSGFGYPRVYEEITGKIKKGTYGEEWKTFFEEHPGAVINAEIELYRCPACNHLEEDYNLSLYEHKEGVPPENGYWAPWGSGKRDYRFVKSSWRMQKQRDLRSGVKFLQWIPILMTSLWCMKTAPWVILVILATWDFTNRY